MSKISDLVNNGFKELFPVESSHIENPPFRHPVVAWHRTPAKFWGDTFWREGDKYFYIFLPAFLLDRLCQLSMLCPGISDNKDHTLVRHVVQGDLNSWEII